jgi:hypothetical protein
MVQKEQPCSYKYFNLVISYDQCIIFFFGWKLSTAFAVFLHKTSKLAIYKDWQLNLPFL